MLQRKDAEHPREDARGKLTWFGGGLRSGELAVTALQREIREEFYSMAIARLILDRAQPWRVFPQLQGYDSERGSAAFVFRAKLPDPLFDAILLRDLCGDLVTEGSLVECTKADLEDFCASADPFLMSNGLVTSEFIEEFGAPLPRCD